MGRAPGAQTGALAEEEALALAAGHLTPRGCAAALQRGHTGFTARCVCFCRAALAAGAGGERGAPGEPALRPAANGRRAAGNFGQWRHKGALPEQVHCIQC